jgi:hypothetical protein
MRPGYFDATSAQHSPPAPFDPPDNHPPPLFDLDNLLIPPAAPDVWDEVLRRRQHQPEDQALSSSGTSATKSASDNSQELDNISVVTVPDHFFGVSAETQGLSAAALLNAEEMVDTAVNGAYN